MPIYMTNDTIEDINGWSEPKELKTRKSHDGFWIDFWVICDREKAHLFFTSHAGWMWRSETQLGDDAWRTLGVDLAQRFEQTFFNSPAQADVNIGSPPETRGRALGLSGRSPVLMMKATQMRNCHNISLVGILYRARHRTLFVER